MMRKISCKLWAYNKNNSNSNMMILYKIILFKKDLWQPVWLPFPLAGTHFQKSQSHLATCRWWRSTRVSNVWLSLWWIRGPISTTQETRGLDLGTPREACTKGVTHKTLGEVLDSPSEWKQHLEMTTNISCFFLATNLQWVYNLCILQVICIIKTLKDSTSHGN